VTEYLTLDSLLRIADRALSQPVVVRDYGLLESALARPRATVFGADAYPTVRGKAAALLHGYDVTATDDELFDLVVSVADGSQPDVQKIGERLEAFSRTH